MAGSPKAQQGPSKKTRALNLEVGARCFCFFKRFSCKQEGGTLEKSRVVGFGTRTDLVELLAGQEEATFCDLRRRNVWGIWHRALLLCMGRLSFFPFLVPPFLWCRNERHLY